MRATLHSVCGAGAGHMPGDRVCNVMFFVLRACINTHRPRKKSIRARQTCTRLTRAGIMTLMVIRLQVSAWRGREFLPPMHAAAAIGLLFKSHWQQAGQLKSCANTGRVARVARPVSESMPDQTEEDEAHRVHNRLLLCNARYLIPLCCPF